MLRNLGAAHYAFHTADLLADYDRRLAKSHKRFLEAVAAENAGVMGPDHVYAVGRVLIHLATSWDEASQIADHLLTHCETRMLHLRHLTDQLTRWLNELRFFTKGMPRTGDQIALH